MKKVIYTVIESVLLTFFTIIVIALIVTMPKDTINHPVAH